MGNVPPTPRSTLYPYTTPFPSFTGDTNSNGLLDTTETWTYTKTATAVAGQQTNVGTATGQVRFTNVWAPDTGSANYSGSSSSVKVVKYVHCNDASSSPGVHVSV